MIIAIAKIGSTVAQFAAASQDANARNAQNEINRKQIADARDIENRGLNLQLTQALEKKAQEKKDKALEDMEGTATAKLAALEGGVEGRLISNIMGKYERDTLTSATNFNSEMTGMIAQNTMDRAGLESKAQGRINQFQPVSKPNPWMMMADVGMSVGEYELAMEKKRA